MPRGNLSTVFIFSIKPIKPRIHYYLNFKSIMKGKLKMKLSKNAFKEILAECERRFTAKIGTSMHNADVWTKFCEKKPVEFRGTINGVEYIIRVANDAYAVCVLNPSGFFKIYSF